MWANTAKETADHLPGTRQRIREGPGFLAAVGVVVSFRMRLALRWVLAGWFGAVGIADLARHGAPECAGN